MGSFAFGLAGGPETVLVGGLVVIVVVVVVFYTWRFTGVCVGVGDAVRL